MNNLTLLLFSAITCITASVKNNAQSIIYNNFGPGDSFSGNILQTVYINLEEYKTWYQSAAVSFSIPPNYDVALNLVEIACGAMNREVFNLSILKDLNGLPEINLFGLGRPSSNSGLDPDGIVKFSFNDTILKKGERYWVTLWGPPVINWQLSNSHTQGYAWTAVFPNGTEGYEIPVPNWSIQDGATPTLRVTATAIPEHESIYYLIVTIAGVTGVWSWVSSHTASPK